MITKVVKDRKIQPVKTVKEFQDLTGKADELAVYVQAPKGPGRFVTLSKTRRTEVIPAEGVLLAASRARRRGRPGVSPIGRPRFIYRSSGRTRGPGCWSGGHARVDGSSWWHD